MRELYEALYYMSGKQEVNIPICTTPPSVMDEVPAVIKLCPAQIYSRNGQATSRYTSQQTCGRHRHRQEPTANTVSSQDSRNH